MMGVSKVQKKDGTVVIDITGDTVTADTMVEGVTAHNAKGEPVTGNMMKETWIITMEDGSIIEKEVVVS